MAERIVIVVQGQADLFEVIGAFDPSRGPTNALDRGKEQAHQHRDDGDHDEQFDQGEGDATHGGPRLGCVPSVQTKPMAEAVNAQSVIVSVRLPRRRLSDCRRARQRTSVALNPRSSRRCPSS